MPEGTTVAQAIAVNIGGVITGDVPAGKLFAPTACTWDDSNLTVFDVPSDGGSEGDDINRYGDVTGQLSESAKDGFHFRAFYRSHDGPVINLGPIPGGLSSRPRGMNDHSEVVGAGILAFDEESGQAIDRAFYWSEKTGMVTIEPRAPYYTSFAYDINDAGDILIEYGSHGELQPPSIVGILQRNGEFVELKTLIPERSGIDPDSSRSWQMNNTGQFAAAGETWDGHEVVFVLTPVPNAPGDVTGDDQVNIDDWTSIILNWNTGEQCSDLDASGSVDIADLTEVIENWSASDKGE